MSFHASKGQPSNVVYLRREDVDKEPENKKYLILPVKDFLKKLYNISTLDDKIKDDRIEILTNRRNFWFRRSYRKNIPWSIVHQIRSAKEGGIMDWQEKYIDKLDKAIEKIDLRIDGVKEDITNLKKEIRTEFNQVIGQFLGEIRDRDNQRHNELLMINQRIDKNIGDLTSEIRATNKWIIGLVIAAIGLVGAAIGLAITAIAAIGR